MERAREEVKVSRDVERQETSAEARQEEASALTLPIGTRVFWDDGDGRWPGVVTAYRDADPIVKLDGGGTFVTQRYQLRRIG